MAKTRKGIVKTTFIDWLYLMYAILIIGVFIAILAFPAIITVITEKWWLLLLYIPVTFVAMIIFKVIIEGILIERWSK